MDASIEYKDWDPFCQRHLTIRWSKRGMRGKTMFCELAGFLY